MTPEDFHGFDLKAAQRYLRGLDPGARARGERYFQDGAVLELGCLEPGTQFTARVQGGDTYRVTLVHDPDEHRWWGDCTCPVGGDCKHACAAMRELLAQQAAAHVHELSASKHTRPVVKRAGRANALAWQAEEKLGRKLTPEEAQFAVRVTRLFTRVQIQRRLYPRDLAELGVQAGLNWYEPLDLWPSLPASEEEFWNYLALWFEEQGRAIPAFLEPVTHRESVRDRMRRHRRALQVQHWKQTLEELTWAGRTPAAPVGPVELRLRFGREEALADWRLPEGEWRELKLSKLGAFDETHSRALGPEAALIWGLLHGAADFQPCGTLGYGDPEVVSVLGRLLRQPLLRPLLADEDGAPLQFSAAPLRWLVTEPAEAGGDYEVGLAQADGQPAPAVWAVFPGQPVLYLTERGVFPGPPDEVRLLEPGKSALIPAKAFETAGGLRLLEHLRAELPPRLAARVRTVPLQLHVRAEVAPQWTGSTTEFCFVDVFGASSDGRHVEQWDGLGWSEAREAGPPSGNKGALVRVDRSGLPNLAGPLEAAGFKRDNGRWSMRVTKKFPEAFVPFLKSLPATAVIELRGELASFQGAEVAGKIRLEACEAGMDWFDLRVLVDVNDATLTPAEVKLLLDAKGKWVRLDQKGWRRLEFTLSEAEDQELARLGLTPHELTSEPQRLHALQLADRAAKKFLPEETCARIERRAAELQARVTPEIPAGITAELRPYQRDGFHFLAYLATNNFGGILADDMGLGKTVQTLAWIEWLRQSAGRSRGNETHSGSESQSLVTSTATEQKAPSLVVCPKSVADNWRAEAERFLPTLRVRVWHASDIKSLPALLDSAELHVINYAQLRTVGDELARTDFLAVILDEGQYIKNPASITAQLARKLRAAHRLILSGTPIENRLLDLWSLMSFAMPGALGSRAEFGRLFDAKGDPFARQRLSARVRPFLIRRTKAQVARDLPDRIEEDLFCELEGEQKTLYRAELKRAQAMLLGIKTPKALNEQRFNFLTSLLRLRQICCHPRLVKPDAKNASAKIEALLETLEPLMEEGAKVLVFSQFVELLDIVRADLKTRGWPLWMLTGATEDRGDLVREFQAAEGAGVFLISLKAGGFGLNLTAASYAVLFDPWWNPAVENQAIDRTHRIGQTRKVIAYRLLIKDSIEEKIRALQKTKSALAGDVLGEEKFSQSLSLDDLRYLLAE
jgi:superfamily II DNA or RNA helicase